MVVPYAATRTCAKSCDQKMALTGKAIVRQKHSSGAHGVDSTQKSQTCERPRIDVALPSTGHSPATAFMIVIYESRRESSCPDLVLGMIEVSLET